MCEAQPTSSFFLSELGKELDNLTTKAAEKADGVPTTTPVDTAADTMNRWSTGKLPGGRAERRACAEGGTRGLGVFALDWPIRAALARRVGKVCVSAQVGRTVWEVPNVRQLRPTIRQVPILRVERRRGVRNS